MQTSSSVQRELVLVGGGHSHVIALRKLAMQPVTGLRITLVSLDSHTPYSGMLPGLIAGHYSFAEAHIDLARLCQWAGARFIAAEVTGLDVAQQRIHLRQRPALDYHLLSLDIGSGPELDSVPGAREHAVPVKPVHSFWQRWQSFIDAGAAPSAAPNTAPNAAPQVAVVGGGAGSVELVLAMAHRLRDKPAQFTLYCGAKTLLADYRQSTRKAVERALRAAGVQWQCGARVSRVNAQSMEFADGRDSAGFDALFWCTAAAPAGWLADTGLATDERGFLALRDTLQLLDHDTVFAAGDVGTQLRHPRPKAGVYAVRQGPVLADNLARALLHKPLKEHRPQRRFLSLLSLGEQSAVAERAWFSASGGWAWRWKDRIDRKFMQRFSDLPKMSRRFARGSVLPADAPPPCGGCGGKVASASLSAVLTDLATEFPQIAPGAAAADAALLPASTGSLWQSLDMLRQLVSDPWLMGRIATQHALNDLYASGLQPQSALALLQLPFAHESVQAGELRQLLHGVLTELSCVDTPLLGGHSLQGEVGAVGLAVTGQLPEGSAAPWAKGDVESGDALVLCKPLGTGVLFAGHMQLATDGHHLQAALASMLLSQHRLVALGRRHGVRAATDVSGFGLAGHLLEMLGNDLAAAISMSVVPALDGVDELLAQGIASSGYAANRDAALAAGLNPALLQAPRGPLLCDPQTSGGLLLALPAAGAEALLAELRAAGFSAAALLGHVRPRGDGYAVDPGDAQSKGITG